MTSISQYFWGSSEKPEETMPEKTIIPKIKPTTKSFVDELKEFNSNGSLKPVEKIEKPDPIPNPIAEELAFHRRRILKLADKEVTLEERVKNLEKELKELKEMILTIMN